MSVRQCSRCLSFDHLTSDCKVVSAAVKERCLKCGETGHTARTCKAEPRCYVCRISGHFANCMGCPEFRARVENLGQKTRKRDG